jgi:hypothetical protein
MVILLDRTCGAAYLGFECEPADDLVVPPSEWESTTQEQQKSVVSKCKIRTPTSSIEKGGQRFVFGKPLFYFFDTGFQGRIYRILNN